MSRYRLMVAGATIHTGTWDACVGVIRALGVLDWCLEVLDA